MNRDDIFFWLVDYHVEKNLDRCLSSMHQGIIYQNGKPCMEGVENELYKGALFVRCHGEPLHFFIDKNLAALSDVGEFSSCPNKDALFSYMDMQEHSDGAFLIDGKSHIVARVFEINNAFGDHLLEEQLPSDFVFFGSSDTVHRRHLGTKTRLSVKLPQLHHGIETFQIKRTGYTDLGMGKVTHFNAHGLFQEFFFKKSPTFDNSDKIVGVYRKYAKIDGQLTCIFEREVDALSLQNKLFSQYATSFA